MRVWLVRLRLGPVYVVSWLPLVALPVLLRLRPSWALHRWPWAVLRWTRRVAERSFARIGVQY